MKRLLNITSVETKATLRVRLVEQFVRQNLPPKIARQNRLQGMGAFADTNYEVESCAAELPVHGRIEILFVVKDAEMVRRINYPISARFIVFCTREDKNDYKVTWSSSLS